MISRMSLVICVLVVLAGCSTSAGLFGDSDETTPTVTPTPLPADTPVASEMPTETPTPTPSALTRTFRDRVYDQINQSRAARGLSRLEPDRQFERGGRATARELAGSGYFRQNRSANTTPPNVYRELNATGVSCVQSGTGSVYVAQLYYQQYVSVSGEFVYYATPSELADAFVSRVTTAGSETGDESLTPRVQALLYSTATTRQGIGLYRSSEDVVYIVYMSCE